MLLDLTLAQLDIGPVPLERADQMGRLGYLQWLGALPGGTSYHVAAMQAYACAAPHCRRSPAVAVFCNLLVASTRAPLALPDGGWPLWRRRGGSKARRVVS